MKLLASFESGRVTPRALYRGKRRFTIEKVNLEYQEREGTSLNYYFAVETNGGDVWKIAYNNERLVWTLEEVWEE